MSGQDRISAVNLGEDASSHGDKEDDMGAEIDGIWYPNAHPSESTVKHPAVTTYTDKALAYAKNDPKTSPATISSISLPDTPPRPPPATPGRSSRKIECDLSASPPLHRDSPHVHRGVALRMQSSESLSPSSLRSSASDVSDDLVQCCDQEMREEEEEEGGDHSSNTSDLSEYNDDPDEDEGVDYPDGDADDDGELGRAAAGDTSGESGYNNDVEGDEVGEWAGDEVDHDHGEQEIQKCAGEEMEDMVEGVCSGEESLGEHDEEDGEQEKESMIVSGAREKDVVPTRELISRVSDALEFQDCCWVRSLPVKGFDLRAMGEMLINQAQGEMERQEQQVSLLAKCKTSLEHHEGQNAVAGQQNAALRTRITDLEDELKATKAEVADSIDINKLRCVYSASAHQASQQIVCLQLENEKLKKKLAAATAVTISPPVELKAIKASPETICPKAFPVVAMRTSCPDKLHVDASGGSSTWKRASLGTLNTNASSPSSGKGSSSKKEGDDTRVCDGNDTMASIASAASTDTSGSNSSYGHHTGPTGTTASPVPTASTATNSHNTSHNKNGGSSIRFYSSSNTSSNDNNRVKSSCGVSGIREKQASARGVGGRSVASGAKFATGVSRKLQNKPSPAFAAPVRPSWGAPRKVTVAAVTSGKVARGVTTGSEENTAERAVAEATRKPVHKGSGSPVSKSGAKATGSRLTSPTASSTAYTATRRKAEPDVDFVSEKAKVLKRWK